MSTILAEKRPVSLALTYDMRLLGASALLLLGIGVVACAPPSPSHTSSRPFIEFPEEEGVFGLSRTLPPTNVQLGIVAADCRSEYYYVSFSIGAEEHQVAMPLRLVLPGVPVVSRDVLYYSRVGVDPSSELVDLTFWHPEESGKGLRAGCVMGAEDARRVSRRWGVPMTDARCGDIEISGEFRRSPNGLLHWKCGEGQTRLALTLRNEGSETCHLEEQAALSGRIDVAYVSDGVYVFGDMALEMHLPSVIGPGEAVQGTLLLFHSGTEKALEHPITVAIGISAEDSWGRPQAFDYVIDFGPLDKMEIAELGGR